MTETPASDSYFDVARERLNAAYVAALSEGRVVVQRCSACSGLQFPPSLGCSVCGAPDSDWMPVDAARVVAAIARPGSPDGVVIVEVAADGAAGCRLVALTPGDVPAFGAQVSLGTVGEGRRWRIVARTTAGAAP